MKIWFDILTPKQIMFFKPAIDILKKQTNYEILCTSRNYREANELSKLKDLDLLIVGNHGGSDLYNKLYQSTKRILELSKIVKDFSPDLLISFSSPEASRVSFGLGINHIGFNDSPHADAVARLTIPLLTTLFSPSVIPVSAWKKYGISSKQIIQYKGLDPVAWLARDVNYINVKDYDKINQHENRDVEFLEKLKINSSKKSILIRLEESKASYISNKKLRVYPLDLVDFVVNSFSDKHNIVILCRYSDQINAVSKRFKNKAIVLPHVVDGIKLLKNIDVFIGAGGTMSAESALLGKPTISIAPIQFYVDDYLKKIGLISRAFTTSQIDRLLNSFLNDDEKCLLLKEHANKVLNEMENPVDNLISFVSQIKK